MSGQSGASCAKAKSQDDVWADALHELSQPLTTLECGLELALRYDTTVAQLRKRLVLLLESAQAMRRLLLELRAKQQERQSVGCDARSDTKRKTIPKKF